MINADKSYHHVFRLYDKVHEILLTDVMEIHTLELRKLPDTAGEDERDEDGRGPPEADQRGQTDQDAI
ncbi:MAG: Rpn family recombination-promoting nuclease/putative transposase [Synergistaceae bacterium]|jgi:hypothetical protein|nr:Rpn family recombination-promoting nuclease/putative transposase [Synergistaceae bacterium]